MHSGGDATGDSTPDRRAEPAATKCSTDRLPGAAPLGAICPARALRHLTPLLDLLRLRCKRLRRSQPSRQFWHRAHRLQLATCSRLRHRPHRPGRKPRTAPLPRSIIKRECLAGCQACVTDRPPAPLRATVTAVLTARHSRGSSKEAPPPHAASFAAPAHDHSNEVASSARRILQCKDLCCVCGFN